MFRVRRTRGEGGFKRNILGVIFKRNNIIETVGTSSVRFDDEKKKKKITRFFFLHNYDVATCLLSSSRDPNYSMD